MCRWHQHVCPHYVLSPLSPLVVGTAIRQQGARCGMCGWHHHVLSSPHVLTIIAVSCGAWWHWWALEGRVAVGTEEIEISHKTAKSEIAKKKQKLVDRGITHGWCSGSNISAPGHGRDLPDRKPVRAGQPVQTKSQCACAPKSFSNPTHWQPSLRPQSAVSHCSGPLSKFITVQVCTAYIHLPMQWRQLHSASHP